MQIVDPYIQVEKVDGTQIMKNIERACRTCYRSEGKITEGSYKTLLKNCITRGHESVLEHEKVTIRMYCDLGVYKDLTRHRIASFSIESTRYCNYGKDKFGNELKFIKPCNMEEGTKLYKLWEDACENIEKDYIEMSNLGALPDQLRMILPHSIAAEVTMTANIREWKHILSLRASSHTHPSIRQIMIPLLLHFKQIMPEIFEDVPYDTEFPKEKYAKLTQIEEIY
ncbi:MAG: FAD-dependent thymidylate synthase [Clostridia bacterium]|nr:FAD-dependent thymidylate synthase [Clostridia bacterium]